jgi:hypothetical protein
VRFWKVFYDKGVVMRANDVIHVLDTVVCAGILLLVFACGKGWITIRQALNIVFYGIFLVMPLYFLIMLVIGHVSEWILHKRAIAAIVQERLNQIREERAYQNPIPSPKQPESAGFAQSVSILSPADIQALNAMRTNLNINVLKSFQKIRLQGASVPNLHLEAGAFTAKIRDIKVETETFDVVVLLSTIQAVIDFQRIWQERQTTDSKYVLEGYLVPSREKAYQVIMVTFFTLNGRAVRF